MSKIVSGGLLAVIVAAPLLAQQQQPQPAPILTGHERSAAVVPADGEVHGLPGKRAGTERWIVHFKTRSFDLSRYRTAVYVRRPAADVEKIVKELARKVIADQRAFVEKIQADLGADVVAQWWLINACAVDVPFKNLARLRAMANVSFLEPDREWHPIILKATNSSNHNSDFVQNVLKIDGKGVAVGIVDTGQDEKMGTLTRPHRTYFINGDSTNTTGSGMGGSRLVVNSKQGLQPADDVHGHGTGVASIAAGGNWGTSGADHGHAFGANIAGYAISNSTGGSTTSAVMASAWNQMAADRVTYNIVAANLSFTGSNSLLDIAQKAIDSVSFNADIMCCTAAGNTSGSTSSSQSNANGLAVAAINADSHTMASFSSRGPLASGRLFPDISGCGVSTVMARRNLESSNYVASGTSMASPQVCGVAALMRAANNRLTALETKAILLATTESIASQNPTRDRNAYGTGMLRGDLAVALAMASSGHGTATINSSNRTIQIPVNVTNTKQYAAVITWHRTNMNSITYSNLDLKVLDGTTVIAESKTPLNLYENVRFLAQKTGTFTLEITSPSLVPTSQKVAYAITVSPAAITPCPGHTSYSVGTTGSAGVPALVSVGGRPDPGNRSFGIALTKARSSSLTAAVFGTVKGLIPFAGGTLAVNPQAVLFHATTASGTASLGLAVPNSAALRGLSLFAQSLVQDSAAVGGVALSNAIEIKVCQ